MMDKQRKLIEKAKRSVAAAEMLMHASDTDFAISRAYYAMFYTAEALLLEKGLTFSKHSAVVAAFGQHFAATGEVPAEYHRYLIDAQEDRNASDYLTEDRVPAERAQEHIVRTNVHRVSRENAIAEIVETEPTALREFQRRQECPPSSNEPSAFGKRLAFMWCATTTISRFRIHAS